MADIGEEGAGEEEDGEEDGVVEEEDSSQEGELLLVVELLEDADSLEEEGLMDPLIMVSGSRVVLLVPWELPVVGLLTGKKNVIGCPSFN